MNERCVRCGDPLADDSLYIDMCDPCAKRTRLKDPEGGFKALKGRYVQRVIQAMPHVWFFTSERPEDPKEEWQVITMHLEAR